MGDDKWHRDSDVMLRTPEHDEAQYLDGAAAPRPRPYPALNWKSVLAPAPASASSQQPHRLVCTQNGLHQSEREHHLLAFLAWVVQAQGESVSSELKVRSLVAGEGSHADIECLHYSGTSNNVSMQTAR